MILAAFVCCSNSLVTFGQVKVVMETLHHTADGRRFLVMHGDRLGLLPHHQRSLICDSHSTFQIGLELYLGRGMAFKSGL